MGVKGRLEKFKRLTEANDKASDQEQAMATDLAPSATDAHKITNTRRTSIRIAVLLCLPAIENLGEMAISTTTDRARIVRLANQ